jgi:hypothetical protein
VTRAHPTPTRDEREALERSTNACSRPTPESFPCHRAVKHRLARRLLPRTCSRFDASSGGRPSFRFERRDEESRSRRDHVLNTDPASAPTVRFASRFGRLIAWTHADSTITLDFPTASPTEVVAPAGLDTALGVKPTAAYRTGALGDLLAVVGDEAVVRGLRPVFTALERLTCREGIRGIIVTSAAANPDRGYDFISR